MSKQDDLSEFLMSRYSFYLLVIIALILELCSCTKEEPSPKEAFVGEWISAGGKNCTYTGSFQDSVYSTRVFTITNTALAVKVSDATHSNLDVVKNILCAIDGNTVYFNTSVTTHSNCENITMVTKHTCVVINDILYDYGTYYLFNKDTLLVGNGNYYSQHIKRQ